jgi:RNA polymerase sigma factor (sigma-70 family)
MTPEIVRWIKIVVLRTLKEKSLTRLDTSTLISAGMLGYAQCLKRFDPEYKVKFKTFAEHRIRGAVLDEVRKMIGDERAKHKRPMKVDNYDFEAMHDGGDTVRMMESGYDIEQFACLIQLSPRELDILRCRVEGHSIREIAQAFDFSESRASQLLARIKKTVYAFYREQGGINFGLATHECPDCQGENIVSDKTSEFECDVCAVRLVIVDGAPIVLAETQTVEIEAGEEDYEERLG